MSHTGNYRHAPQQESPFAPPTTYGQPPTYGPPPQYSPPPIYGPPPGTKGNWMAVTALVLGIVALLLCLVPIINNFAAVLAVAGVVFGVIGWRAARTGARSGKGMAVAGVVLSVIALVGVVGSQVFYGKVLDEASKSLDQASKDVDAATGDDTAGVLARSVDVQLGKFRAKKDRFGTVTSSMPVAAVNKDKAAKNFDIQIVATGANGDQVAVDHFYVENLKPGQRKMGKVFQFLDVADAKALLKAKFTVQQVSMS